MRLILIFLMLLPAIVDAQTLNMGVLNATPPVIGSSVSASQPGLGTGGPSLTSVRSYSAAPISGVPGGVVIRGAGGSVGVLVGPGFLGGGYGYGGGYGGGGGWLGYESGSSYMYPARLYDAPHVYENYEYYNRGVTTHYPRSAGESKPIELCKKRAGEITCKTHRPGE